MRRVTVIASIFAAAVFTLALAIPADAQHRRGGGGSAQRPSAGAPARPSGGRGSGQVAVPRPNYPHGGGYYPGYRPYYGYRGYYPYYYAPYWGFGLNWGWGYPYWGGYWGWGYPYYGGGYPYWYGYPYPYYHYYDPTGSVRTQVKPLQTQVFVDGYLAGVADDFDGTFQRLHVKPGEHHILLHLTGYRNASQTIYVQAGNTYKLTHQMEPLPAGAPQDPVPQPDPKAAAGDERAPNRVERQPGEPREPYPPRQPYPPREPNPPNEPNPPREPIPPNEPPSSEPRGESRFGAVAIRVEPADAAIIIDGQPWRGPADQDGSVVIQLSAGRHRIEIGRSGFERYETEIDVRPGTTTPVNVMLQRR